MEIRNNAFSNYSSLPHEVSPLYKKYSDANLLYPDRVYLSQETKSYIPEDYINERIRELKKETSILKIGSSIVHSNLPDKVLKQGVVISDLKSAIRDYGNIIRDRMNSNQLNYSEDKFLALELSCFDSGIFVYIPRNVVIDNSIRIIDVLAPDGLSSITRNIVIADSNSKASIVQEIYSVNDQSIDVTSNLIHYGPNTRGRVLSKSVMKDKSKSLFKGMIKIDKNGKSAESFLAGHAILLDKGAKSDTIPGLEIETNEVRATHAASVAQIDENQIFYLMSRGLSNEEAKREIVSGFLEPLCRKIGPTIRAWINYLIENKWLGKPLLLKTDEAMEYLLEVEKSRYRETEDIFEKHYKYR